MPLPLGQIPLHIQGAVPRGMSYVLRGIINFFVKLNIVGLNFQVLNRNRFVALKLGIIRQFRFINLTNVGTVYFNRFFYGTPFSWDAFSLRSFSDEISRLFVSSLFLPDLILGLPCSPFKRLFSSRNR